MQRHTGVRAQCSASPPNSVWRAAAAACLPSLQGGWSLLHTAVMHRKPATIKALLAMKCNVWARNERGMTALFVMAQAQGAEEPALPECIALLLGAGESIIDARDHVGGSPVR